MENIIKKETGRLKLLNSFHMKLIAVITMLIDHTGAILYPGEILFRQIGRISFPIYCFLLVEGYVHSKNIKKYLLRLFVFAVVSEIPYDLAFYKTAFDWKHQNVFLTLFIGLLCLYLLERCHRKLTVAYEFLGYGIVVAGAVIAEFLFTDYGLFGVTSIFIFYQFRRQQALRAVWVGFLNYVMSTLQLYAIFSLIPITLYNGKKGYSSKPLQYFFYAFYPLHLLVLYYIAVYIR